MYVGNFCKPRCHQKAPKYGYTTRLWHLVKINSINETIYTNSDLTIFAETELFLSMNSEMESRLLMCDYNLMPKVHNYRMRLKSDAEATNMRLLHVQMHGRAQMWFKSRQLCEFGHSDEWCLKILAKNVNICLSKGWRGVFMLTWASTIMQKWYIPSLNQAAESTLYLGLITASIVKAASVSA